MKSFFKAYGAPVNNAKWWIWKCAAICMNITVPDVNVCYWMSVAHLRRLYRRILQWLHRATKASLRRSTVQEVTFQHCQNLTVVIFFPVLTKKVIPFYTDKDFWTIVFSFPLGEHHISDKSITLPARL